MAPDDRPAPKGRDAEVDALLREGFEARRRDRPAEARRSFEAAAALCREDPVMPGHLARALKGLGQIDRDEDELASALAFYEEAEALCRTVGDRQALAHTVRHVGDIHQDMGRLDLAEPCYAESLEIYRSDRRTKPLDLANAVRPYALLKESTGVAVEARDLWLEARVLYAALGIQAGVDEADVHLAGLAT